MATVAETNPPQPAPDDRDRRLTPHQRHRRDTILRQRDIAIAHLQRFTPALVAELIRRGDDLPGPDGYTTPAGTPGPSVGSSSTERAAVGRTVDHDEQGNPIDPPPRLDVTGADIIAALGSITEAAGVLDGGQRALDNVFRGTGWDPGRWDPTCDDCGDRASNHPDQPGWRLRGDWCPACYEYRRTHEGERRPRARTFGAP